MNEQEQKKIFGEWLQQYQALIFKVVHAYAFTPADRDDLFQEIAIQIWRSIPNFQEYSKPVTWLYRIALNTALNWRRSARQHQSQALEPVAHLLQQGHPLQDERLVWLYEQIAGLNEIDRSLTLLLLDGFSYKEMAAIMGISETNIGVKIHRIKKLLIRQAKEYEHHGI